MNFDQAVRNINRSLVKKQPKFFDPIWIKCRCKVSYQFIVSNVKNELGDPDWDSLTSKLDRQFQKLWLKGVKNKNKVDEYENEAEVLLVLSPNRDKLYTFVSQVSQDDRIACDYISIRLVRLAQKGNALAAQKLKQLIIFLINQWIEGYKLNRLRGYEDQIDQCITACIRRYRYSGSFIGYLNRTLEYSSRPLRAIEAFSLDKASQITGKTTANRTSKDYLTGEVKIFK